MRMMQPDPPGPVSDPNKPTVVSAEQGTGLEELRNAVYAAMDAVRVYTKLPSAKEADRDRPRTRPRGRKHSRPELDSG